MVLRGELDRARDTGVGRARGFKLVPDLDPGGCRVFQPRFRVQEELSRVWVLRKVLSPLSTVEAMELLLSRLTKTKTNLEFLGSMSAPT